MRPKIRLGHVLAFLGATLVPGTLIAGDLTYELDKARADYFRAEAELRALEIEKADREAAARLWSAELRQRQLEREAAAAAAEHATLIARDRAREADFARFEAENRVDVAELARREAGRQSSVVEIRRLRPYTGSYVYQYEEIR